MGVAEGRAFAVFVQHIQVVMRSICWRKPVMVNRSRLVARIAMCGGMVFAVLAIVGPGGGSPASAAGVPPGFAQGFSEIVKKTTPAVVNIAVTGGEAGGRRRGGCLRDPSVLLLGKSRAEGSRRPRHRFLLVLLFRTAVRTRAPGPASS